MMRWLLAGVLVLLFGMPSQAQRMDDEALRRIETAQQNNSPSLTLRDLGLEALPDELFALAQLEELYLSGNHIRDLDGLQQLQNLRLLDLTDNDIEQLPPDVLALPHLQTLRLRYNALVDPPQEIVDSYNGDAALLREYIRQQQRRDQVRGAAFMGVAMAMSLLLGALYRRRSSGKKKRLHAAT